MGVGVGVGVRVGVGVGIGVGVGVADGADVGIVDGTEEGGEVTLVVGEGKTCGEDIAGVGVTANNVTPPSRSVFDEALLLRSKSIVPPVASSNAIRRMRKALTLKLLFFSCGIVFFSCRDGTCLPGLSATSL